MQFREAIKIALESLRVNRLRSVLTLLGVVIGVMTVITVVAFISGMNSYVEGEIFTLGADVFYVSRTPEIILDPDEWARVRQRKNLLLDDATAVRDHCVSCVAVGARRNAGARAKYGPEELPNVQVRGLTPEVPTILSEELEAGREVTAFDVRQSRRVAVVGADVVENLFPLVDPLGKRISINGREFEIVGIGEALGPVLGQSRDNWIAIPISSFEKMWGSRGSVTILGKADGDDNLESAQDEARAILRARRHVPFGDDDDFSIQTNDTFLELWASLSQTFFAVTIAIASISLVVGGIVVMNIMLVSVTERTREIGVRKAIGARKIDILMQVLIESATLTGIGGIIGVGLATLFSMAVSGLTGFPAVIEIWAVALGLGVSTGVGLFFGIWPARKAAALDPITALRSE